MQPWTAAGHAALGRPDVSEVRRLEDLSHRSWPPLEVGELGGWALRAAGGVTRRINSAWPRRPCTLTPEQLLAATRAWYDKLDLPPMVQLSPANAPDLTDHLSGWQLSGETLVLEGPLTADDDAGVVVGGWPTDDWWSVVSVTAAHHFGGSRRAAGQAVLGKIAKPAGYAVAYADGVPVAVGRGVVDGRQLGVFTVGTLPDHRGHGHGRQVMGALGAWAAGLGATTTWLQVEADNAAARALYAGLSPVYSYAYASWPSSDR
jgi:ribosomal protein S18 acetylase RimI-like enzyme